AGVEVRTASGAAGILHEGARIRGVRLDDGATLAADRVLLAAGAWSGIVQGLPRPLPVRPVRGQMLALHPETLPSSYVLETPDVNLVPRDDGRLLVGATVEEAGFEGCTTAAGIRGLLAAAIAAVPELARARTGELWWGFRPGTPDGHPI